MSKNPILDEMLVILDTPEKWTQGVIARDRHGDVVRYDDPMAVCWCLSGALDLAYTRYCRVHQEEMDPIPLLDERTLRIKAAIHLAAAADATLRRIMCRRTHFYMTVESYNDMRERTFAEIRAVVEEAACQA